MDDDEAFIEAMDAVARLNFRPKVVRKKNAEGDASAHSASQLRRGWVKSAMVYQPKSALVADGDCWTLRVSGVSAARMKQLAQVRESVLWELDLHGKSEDEALDALAGFLHKALQQGVREVCVVHGRGLHSSGKAVLKRTVYQGLQFGTWAEQVLAVRPKPGSHGGACLILLRKMKGGDENG
ncbi:MAG: Smr/MutS family protein [Zetaproteobacteria bacterium]|nr:Smr/MutS family protein [Zetaproteobacteria bacterium]